MQFKPKAWSKNIHNELLASHDSISNRPGLRRGDKFEAWSHGQMVAIGSRMPSGGIKGDCLREYPGVMAGTTVADIRKLFQYAAVSASESNLSSSGLKSDRHLITSTPCVLDFVLKSGKAYVQNLMNQVAIPSALPALISTPATITQLLSILTMTKDGQSALSWRKCIAKKTSTTFHSLNGEYTL